MSAISGLMQHPGGYDPAKFDPVSGDPLDDDGIPWPKRPGTKWEPIDSRLMSCKNCGKGYNDHGSSKDHLLCKAPDEEWQRYNRARALRHRDSLLALITKDLNQLSDEQRGDLFHRLRDTFCLNCGARCEQKTCKCPNAERC